MAQRNLRRLHSRPEGSTNDISTDCCFHLACCMCALFLRTDRAPLENLLRPVHAQKSVHLPVDDHLQLRRVPQLVVGDTSLQLAQRVQVRARVARVMRKGLARPGVRAGHLVVALVVEATGHKQSRQATAAHTK